MATRKPRRLKFGSPAWQKKYNPAFKGGKKKKAAKRTTKKLSSAVKAAVRKMEAASKRNSKRRKTTKKPTKRARPRIAQLRQPKSPSWVTPLSKRPRRYEVLGALDLSVKVANLLRLNSKERAVIANMVEKRMQSTKRK